MSSVEEISSEQGDQKDKTSVHLHIDVGGSDADGGDEDEELSDRGVAGHKDKVDNFGFSDDIESTIEGHQYLSGSSILNESSIESQNEPDADEEYLETKLKMNDILSKSRRGQFKSVQNLEKKFGSELDPSKSQADVGDGEGKGESDDDCADDEMNEVSKKNSEVMRELRQMSKEKFAEDDESLKSVASSTRSKQSNREIGSVEESESSQSIVDIRALNLDSTLTVFEALAVSTILQDIYTQLDLLGYAIHGPHLSPEKGDALTYDERFTLEVDAKELQFMPKLKNFKNKFEHDETTAGTPQERLNLKIQKDRAYLQEVIRQVYEEMIATRTFETLKNNVKREEGRRNEESQMVSREKTTLDEINFMKQKIANFEKQAAKDEHNRVELIHHLKDQLFQAKQQDLRDNRYTRALYMARNEHNLLDREHQSELIKMKIKAVEIDMTRDHLAHKNIEIWSTLCYEEILKKIQEWKDKFDTDETDIEEKIKSTQENIRAQQAMIEEINRTIEEKMDEMGPWLEEKEKGRMEKVNWLRDTYAAKKIQRWWREYMVKNNLYKKKKKKGVKGKGSKKSVKKSLKSKSKLKSKTKSMSKSSQSMKSRSMK